MGNKYRNRRYSQHAQEVVVAKGGKGGRAMRHLQPPALGLGFCGKRGKRRRTKSHLDLKSCRCRLGRISSVGKSTLISVVSAAKPKSPNITLTLNPNLGVVGVPDGRSFIMADLPGLIEGRIWERVSESILKTSNGPRYRSYH